MQDILYDNKPGFFKKEMPQKSFFFKHRGDCYRLKEIKRLRG